MNRKSLPLKDIRTDATQCRAGTSFETVADYAEQMRAGDEFPPLTVFFDGENYFLADGFHRHAAASHNQAKSFPCNVLDGTASDAIWFGLGANRTNGHRLSPGDKRHAIELALSRFPTKSQQEIASQVGCDQGYVSKVKQGLVMTCHNQPETRVDSRGHIQPTSKPRPQTIDIEAVVGQSVESPEPAKPCPPSVSVSESMTSMELQRALDDGDEHGGIPGAYRTFPAAAKSKPRAERWWFNQSTPLRRGDFISFLMTSDKSIEVADKAAFAKIVNDWLEKVEEANQ